MRTLYTKVETTVVELSVEEIEKLIREDQKTRWGKSWEDAVIAPVYEYSNDLDGFEQSKFVGFKITRVIKTEETA